MLGMTSLPIEVWQNITVLLDAKDIGHLLCCSRTLHTIFVGEMARKPLVWETPRATAFNLRFWDTNRDLTQNVKSLSISITAQIPADVDVRRYATACSLINVHGNREGIGFANSSQHAQVAYSPYIATAPLYAKILETMRWFTSLQSLTFKGMRLPPGISSLIRAFPQLCDLDISSCAMSNCTAGILYDPPDSLRRLNLSDIYYPPVATQRSSYRRPLTDQEFHLIAPLITLVQAPNLRTLSLDPETATVLTLSSLSPLSDTLQDLQVTKRVENPQSNWPLGPGSWSSLIIMQLLMICPSIESLRVPSASSDSTTIDALETFWDSDMNNQVLKRLHSYTGPLKLALLLVRKGRIPKELQATEPSRSTTYVLSISCRGGYMSLMGHSWRDASCLDLYQILMATLSKYPGEIKRFGIYGSWSWSGIPESLPSALTGLVTLEGTLEAAGKILERWRFFREILVSCFTMLDQVCNWLSRDRGIFAGVESLCITRISSWDSRLLVEVLNMPCQLRKLEIAYEEGFASQDELFTFGQSLLERYPYLADLRIYNKNDSSISWLALPVEPVVLDFYGVPLTIDWTEMDPPLTAEEELEQLLNVWHRKSARLKVVQIAAKSVWRLDGNGDGLGRWTEERD